MKTLSDLSFRNWPETLCLHLALTLLRGDEGLWLSQSQDTLGSKHVCVSHSVVSDSLRPHGL